MPDFRRNGNKQIQKSICQQNEPHHKSATSAGPGYRRVVLVKDFLLICFIKVHYKPIYTNKVDTIRTHGCNFHIIRKNKYYSNE